MELWEMPTTFTVSFSCSISTCRILVSKMQDFSFQKLELFVSAPGYDIYLDQAHLEEYYFFCFR